MFISKNIIRKVNIELEHNKINSNTNITKNDLINATKIVLTHLNKYPNYYNKKYGLKKFK